MFIALFKRRYTHVKILLYNNGTNVDGVFSVDGKKGIISPIQK